MGHDTGAFTARWLTTIQHLGASGVVHHTVCGVHSVGLPSLCSGLQNPKTQTWCATKSNSKHPLRFRFAHVLQFCS